MTEIRKISYADIFGASNARCLLNEYSLECSIPEIGEARPQAEIYEALEKSGSFQAFGIYDGDTLIGFVTVIIWTIPHYGKKIASTESIFIARKYRHKGIGRDLLNFIEDYAKKNGCVAFQYTAPVGSRFSQLLALNVDRYRRTNHVYLRDLK